MSGNTYLYNEGTVYECVHALLRFPSQIIQTRCQFHSKRQCLHEMNNNVFVWLVSEFSKMFGTNDWHIEYFR